MILIKFVVKVWPSGLKQYVKRKLFAGAFQEFLQKNSKYLLFRTLFVECFCYNERIKGMLKCLLYIALISNAFFDESKDKRKRYSLRSVRSEGKKWKIQYLLKPKTHLVRFVFGFRYQTYGKSKSQRLGSMVDLEPVKSVSAVLSV